MGTPVRHLTQSELALRWNKSEATIERYRADGKGPHYLKIGGKCLYRLEDIEEYELSCLRRSPYDRPEHSPSGRADAGSAAMAGSNGSSPAFIQALVASLKPVK